MNAEEALWGELEPEMEMFYDKFSPVTGEVVEGWNFDKFTLDRMAGCRHTSTINAHTTMRPLTMDDLYLLINATQRNVARGCQSQQDLDDLIANGHVTKPKSYRHQRQMCLDAAFEYVELVEAGKRSKREIV